MERYEEVIEDWYKGNQEEDLTTYLCEKHVLKGQDAGNAHTYIDLLFFLILFLAIIMVCHVLIIPPHISLLCSSFLILFFLFFNLYLLCLNPLSFFPVFLCPACLKEDWNPKKKGDQAAIAEDKKKKKKKKGGKKGKGEEGGKGGDGSSDGEKTPKKKKEKKVKKKKKSKAPVEKVDGGVTSDEEIQAQVPLSGQKTELWDLSGPELVLPNKTKLSVKSSFRKHLQLTLG